MNGVKATLIICLTALVTVAVFVVYGGQLERFVVVPIPQEKAVYVFDKKNNTLNYCTPDHQCKMFALQMPVPIAQKPMAIKPVSGEGKKKSGKPTKHSDHENTPEGMTSMQKPMKDEGGETPEHEAAEG